jgi:hypothetical protein
MALVRNTAIGDMPLLGAKCADEFFVVRYHDYTALEVTNSDGETTEGVTIQEISRLIEDEEMRVVPHGTSYYVLVLFRTE